MREVADALPPMSLVAIRWRASRACGINSLPRSKTPSMSKLMAPVVGLMEAAEDSQRAWDDNRLIQAARSKEGGMVAAGGRLEDSQHAWVDSRLTRVARNSVGGIAIGGRREKDDE